MKILTLLFAIAFTIVASLQVAAQTTGAAINTSGATADPSAMLDVSSTTSGILIPRMTGNDRSNILNPVQGLLVYQTDAPAGFWYFDGSIWTQIGGGGGGGTNVACNTPFDGRTIRYDGATSQWECTDMIEIMKGPYKYNASIGNNAAPSSYFTLLIKDRDTITFPPDPTVYYYEDTRVGMGSSPYSSSSFTLSVDGGAHIDDGLRVGTTTAPPSNGILSYGDIKTTYGDIILGSSSSQFCVGSSCGLSTNLPFVFSISVSTTSYYVASGTASGSGHSYGTMVRAVTACTRTMSIRGGIIVGVN